MAATLKQLGSLSVSPMALGGASWCFGDYHGNSSALEADEANGVAAIHTALDCGITVIDTAHGYTTADQPGQSEKLIARALKSHPLGADVIVATKGGFSREGSDFPIRASADAVRRQCEASCEFLGVDQLDLYQLHVPDPEIPMASAMKVFAQLRDEGLIREVGICNASISELEEAASAVPIASIQNEFSPLRQQDRVTLDYCSEHSIAYLAHSPFGGGPAPRGGLAEELPDAFPGAAAVARRRGISIYRLVLAWLIGLSDLVIPICGAGRPKTVEDSAAAMTMTLTEQDLAELDF